MDEPRQGQEGVQGLCLKLPPTGATPRPSDQERAQLLPEFLERGAQAHGFRGEVWTLAKMAKVIRGEFGVSYHPAHVSRIVRRGLGFSLQKPARRADQRDEEAIEHCKENKWPCFLEKRL